MPSILRDARTGDQSAIDELLTALAVAPSDWTGWPPERIRSSTKTRQMVAIQASKTVGSVIHWQNDLHPERQRVNLGVHPHHRRQGIAQALWERIAERTAQRWQTNIDSRNVAGQSMLERNGFDLIMTTHLGRLRPAKRPVPPPALPTDWSLIRLVDAPATVRDRNGMARLHRDIYAHQHSWDPVDCDVLSDEAVELFTGPSENEIDPDNTVLACRAGIPLGVGSLRGGVRTGVVDLGWVGVLDQAESESNPVTVALTNWCMARAAELNVEVALEVDDANAPVLTALAAWSVIWDQEFLTYAIDSDRSQISRTS